jgi:acyl-CoA synthetase (NDP forming)
LNELEIAFHPRSVAVVGASELPLSAGHFYLRHLLDYGYRGKIYPINPNQKEVLGRKTYPGLKDVPGPVDYVICCLPASKVLALLAQCPQKEVKAIHFFTGRLSETGFDDAVELEKEIIREARKHGIRLIGPNCMGIYHPKEGLSFGYEFPTEPGSVGAFFQSGGAATEFVRYASLRGVRFSKVVSYGNALDLDENDFLQYLFKDPETEVIASYIEGVKDGRRFLPALREAASSKPVIVLKAGRGSAGGRSAASHTASLAGSLRVWEGAIRQTGALQVRTLEELVDLVASFCFLPPVRGKRVGIVGGGGGKSVLSADEWEEAGFEVVPLSPEIREEIKRRVPEIWWDWIRNPVDVSIMPDEAWVTGLTGDIMKMMAAGSYFDLLVANLTVDAPFGQDVLSVLVSKEVEDIIELKKIGPKPLVVVLNTGNLGIKDFEDWRWRLLAELNSHLVSARIPVYPTIRQAARSVYRMVEYYQKDKR